jgi:hypothetical protein
VLMSNIAIHLSGTHQVSAEYVRKTLSYFHSKTKTSLTDRVLVASSSQQSSRLQAKTRQRHYFSMMYKGKRRVEEVDSTPTSSTRPSPPFFLHPRIVLCCPNQTLGLVPVAVHSTPLPLSLLTSRPRQGCKINVTPPGNSFTRSPSNQPTNQPTDLLIRLP